MSASTPPASRWADMPSDLLRDVSTRLSNVADFVRFHAICRPWRDLQLNSPAALPAFPPWLLGSSNGLILHSVVNFGATSSHRRRDCDDIILPSPPGAPSTNLDRNWVASADCAAAQLFTWSPEPSLVDLLTGAVTRLPLFPCDDEKRRLMENPHGIIYNDGTIFLYGFIPEVVDECIRTPIFPAAILGPGDAAWTSGTKRIDVPKSRYLGVAYHDGMVVLCMGRNFWYVMTLHDLGGEMVMTRWKTFRHGVYIPDGNYVFESCGQLMWASILVKRQPPSGGDNPPPPSAISVTMEVLKETKEGGGMGWVPRDGRSLGDRVLFLGSPASFAVDAVQLGVPGGCAYFVCRTGVFWYNLVNDEAELLEQLRPGRVPTGPLRGSGHNLPLLRFKKSKKGSKLQEEIRK